MVVALSAVGMLGGGVWHNLRQRGLRQEGPTPFDVAEAFVEELLRADGQESEDPASRTGYRAAYELLSADLRSRRSYEDFYEEWARRADAAGFFVRREWTSRGPKNAARALRQQFLLATSPQSDEATESGRLLDLRLVPEDGSYRIARYDVSPAPVGGSK
jgi:hypothetical protein